MLTSGRVWPTPPRSDDSTPRATAATARSRLAQALDFETPAAGADVLPPRPAGEDLLLRPRRRHRPPPRCRGPAGVSGEPEATNVGCCHANTVHPMAELNPALLLIRIGGESGEPGVLDGPTHREMVEVLVGEVLEAKDTMHGVVEVTPDTSAPNPGSFGF